VNSLREFEIVPKLNPPSRLVNHLRRSLPQAELLSTQLPQLRQIKLWLVNPDSMTAKLADEVVAAILAEPAYWSFCWASGQALARKILQSPEIVKDKTVLDFGSGSGVVAIAAVMAGAKKVIACDCDPGALLAIEANAELNQVELILSDDLFSIEDNIDFLTAADVLYDGENKALLAKFLQLANGVLIADSRVRNLSEPGYHCVGSRQSISCPDMGELEQFRQVNFYSNLTDLP